MIISFGLQTLTGLAQPLLGDKNSVAFTGIPTNGIYTVKVASSAIYRAGWRIQLGWGQAKPNTLLIQTIPDATTLQCVSEGNAPVTAWPVNTIIALAESCFEIGIEGLDGNAADIILGTDSTVTNAAVGSAFWKLSKTAAGTQGNAFKISKSTGQNPLMSTEVTVAGTAADKYFAYIDQN